jgi:hypothetical protein
MTNFLFAEVSLLTALTGTEGRTKPKTTLCESLPHSGLFGVQLDLGDRASGVAAKVQPHGFFSPAEDALKRRVT